MCLVYPLFCSDQCEDMDTRNYLLTLNCGLSKVLSHIFNCNRFATEILCNFRGEHIRVCLEISQILLQSVITSSDWYLNNKNVNKNIIHHLIFVCIPKGIVLLTTPQ